MRKEHKLRPFNYTLKSQYKHFQTYPVQTTMFNKHSPSTSSTLDAIKINNVCHK